MSEERSAVIEPTVTSIGAALRDATARLAASSETPRLDAELLLAEVLGGGRERLILDRDLRAGSRAGRALRTRCWHVARRVSRSPTSSVAARSGT